MQHTRWTLHKHLWKMISLSPWCVLISSSVDAGKTCGLPMRVPSAIQNLIISVTSHMSIDIFTVRALLSGEGVLWHVHATSLSVNKHHEQLPLQVVPFSSEPQAPNVICYSSSKSKLWGPGDPGESDIQCRIFCILDVLYPRS